MGAAARAGTAEEGEGMRRRTEMYRISYAASVIVTVTLAMIGAMQVAAESLELSRQQTAALGVLAAGLGVLAGFLPRVTMPPSSNRKGLD
jgi:hypothetical protein